MVACLPGIPKDPSFIPNTANNLLWRKFLVSLGLVSNRLPFLTKALESTPTSQSLLLSSFSNKRS